MPICRGHSRSDQIVSYRAGPHECRLLIWPQSSQNNDSKQLRNTTPPPQHLTLADADLCTVLGRPGVITHDSVLPLTSLTLLHPMKGYVCHTVVLVLHLTVTSFTVVCAEPLSSLVPVAPRTDVRFGTSTKNILSCSSSGPLVDSTPHVLYEIKFDRSPIRHIHVKGLCIT